MSMNGGANRDERREPRVPVRRPRLAVALGDAGRELLFLATLDEWEEFASEVCVHAAELTARVRAGEIDAMLVSSELPGLTPAVAMELARTHVGERLVLLAPEPTAHPWGNLGLPAVLPLEATPADVRAVLAVGAPSTVPTGRRPQADAPVPARLAAPARPEPSPDRPFAVLAVASGAGSPGRTMVALGLAAALGAVAPTALVDADLAGPSLAALLDANPRRNVFQVAYGRPEGPGEWDEALGRALQPLGARSPHGRALCGMATAAMRAGVSPQFFGRLVGELQARFRHVILDLGADLFGTDVALHRTALGLADQILLVTTPDLTDLLRAQAALDGLELQLGLERERVALVVNRHDRRRHPGRREIEWGLGRPLAALVPHDHAGVGRAKAARRPVVLERCSRAGRALLELAGRVHGGAVALPPDPPGRWWRRLRPWHRGEQARKSPVPEAIEGGGGHLERWQRIDGRVGVNGRDDDQQPDQDHRARTCTSDRSGQRRANRRERGGRARHAARR